MDFEVVKCTGAQALSQLWELRAKFPANGKYPFLIGDKKKLDDLLDEVKFHRRFIASMIEEHSGKKKPPRWFIEGTKLGTIENDEAKIIAKAKRLNVADWFRDRKEKLFQEHKAEELWDGWGGETWEDRITAHLDSRTGKPKRVVYMGLAEIKEPWMLPAITRMCGSDSGLYPVEHCALMRYWQRKFGVEIVSIGYDRMECLVEKPPQTKAAATKLAWEHFSYCSDSSASQPFISTLAPRLLGAKCWSFWWD